MILDTHNILPPVEMIEPAVITFLAQVDEVIVNDHVPTAATALARGRLLLLLGKLYLGLSMQGRAEVLLHECGHFLMGHLSRQKDRTPNRWNMVCDAAIHFTHICDWELIEAEAQQMKEFPGFKCVTFDRLHDKETGLPLTPMPPEIAYDRLPEEVMVSCGSMEWSEDDGSAESLAKRAIAGGRILRSDEAFAKRLGGREGGKDSGSRLAPELKGPKDWIKQVLQYLVSTRERSDRRRSWRREHRSFPVLPGQSRRFAKGGLFFLDASGSIPDDQLAEFLACVLATPELKGSDVIIFDSTPSAMIPITDVASIVAACKSKGGGTCIKYTGEKCRDHRPAIWITDGYTGDGWPSKHVTTEVWCVWGQGPTSPNASVTIHIPE